ncbi:hypothetical protein FLAVO9AF_220044 [Flavobacterium sp. 9AF]|uniref:hypothetical protein n=1 Tax=Flavobacterium sp. 9AF TaxID=2653142 RepID=UPI0012F101B1|nr:hypothetical protein [Flavobacterium sp. 9AF]VXB60723.1 hypothetical protein FLAVO9AF_220044 [Flavobacterium sp. 9AF]
MKQLLIFTLLISNLFLLNISKEKMILGEWRYVKTVLSIEKIGDNLYQKRTSGFIGKTILEFKANYNGTCINTQTKIANQFTWQINRKKYR